MQRTLPRRRRAGLSASSILVAATRSGAEALGMIDKVGTIAEGKLADIVILDGDPLQNLGVLQRPVAVLQGGRVVSGALPTR
jgi:imidazolonepropionase-like amidohydrolase